MLRFENYFCCLLNCYFIFCSFVLLSELYSHLTKNRQKRSYLAEKTSVNNKTDGNSCYFS